MIKDRVSAAYARIVKPAHGVEIKVGVLEGDEQHGDDDLTILELATIHEFGTDNIPARSFIRGWFDENQDAIRAVLLQEFRKEVESGDYLAAGERVVLWAVASIQKRIADRIPPPLDPKTIARKGSSVPLIDTGVLRSSITGTAELRGGRA